MTIAEAIAGAIAYVEGHIDYGGWAARSGRTGDLLLSLDRMQRLMALLGQPQHASPVIHITGTNGKGSTSRMITRLLMAEGLKVGTYSSPHLARYNERLRVDDLDIDDANFAELLATVADAEERLGDRLMPFEALTAAAFMWFAAQRVDVAVIEVGVLGRFDATNVVDAKVAVVTNIGFDHTSGEGDWQQRIASEKAGIVKPGAHLILGSIEARHHQVFIDQRPAQVWALGTDIVIHANDAAPGGRLLSVRTPVQRFEYLRVPLRGEHQGANAALAVAAAVAFLGHPLRPECVEAGLAAVEMPARLEVVREHPMVVLDGAHNPDAAAALARALSTDLPCAGRRTLIVGLLAGRDPAAMLNALAATEFDTVITCTPPTPRARDASELAIAARVLGCDATATPSVADAVSVALATAGPHDQIVVTGSIYLVAQARDLLIP